MTTVKVIDTHFEKEAALGHRWQVRVLSTGQVLYSFRWKRIAVAVGEAVATERGMKHFVRNRKGEIIERWKYVKSGGAVIRVRES